MGTGRRIVGEIQAQVKRLLILPGKGAIKQELFAMHRRLTAIGSAFGCAHPVKESDVLAIEPRVDVRALRRQHGAALEARKRLAERLWRLRSQRLIDVGEMLAVK